MNTSRLALTLFFAASSLLAVACGGGKSSSGNTSGAASGSPAAGGKAVVATCVRTGACTEYRNEIPVLAEELCKGTGEKFNKGSTPCSTDKLVGTCTPKLSPDSVNFYYGGPEENDIDKGLCEALDGVWAPAPRAAASGAAATQPAKAAGAAGAAQPAKAAAHEPKAATPAPAKPAPAPAPKKKK